jgi:hypothetical protein
MTRGHKPEIKAFSDVFGEEFDRIPNGTIAENLGIKRRQLRRLDKCLRDAEIEEFDRVPWSKRYSRQAAEIVWNFYHWQKLDGIEFALLRILGEE